MVLLNTKTFSLIIIEPSSVDFSQGTAKPKKHPTACFSAAAIKSKVFIVFSCVVVVMLQLYLIYRRLQEES